MSDIFGGIGAIISGSMQADAARDAANIQVSALEKARKFVYENLDPSLIAGLATGQDVSNAKQRLALQRLIDPGLSALRFSSQGSLFDQVGQIGQGPASVIGKQAAEEALASGPQNLDLRNRLIDAALTELDAGATLPPDVQAEFVKAGLEKSGMVTGAASPQGFGGLLVRKEIGQGAIKLQADRQQRAAALTATAAQLEQQRQSILGSLFPNLNATQLANIAATGGAFNLSNSAVPTAGLTGSDIANLWAARVGASTQLSQKEADAKAAGTLGAAQGNQTMAGGLTSIASNLAPSWGTVKGWFSGPGYSNGMNREY